MAIIKPSKTFIGSSIDFKDAGRYIRNEVRQVTFSKRMNANGAYLYFLPPYKQDANGNGVWYKSFKIRDNFGEKVKEKYVSIERDPVEHFERNLKVLYPQLAEVTETADERGQTRKVYPLCGRTTTRVVYNVAYFNNLEAGAHVLDLPSYNGASIITNWLNEKDTRGRERPCLNDPEKCIPVFIKLKEGGGAPWQIEPSQSEATAIPPELADSDNLYDLDNIFIRRTPAELIEKLRELYPSEVFDRCMSGYPGFDSVTVEAAAPIRAAAPLTSRIPSAKLPPQPTAVSAVANIATLDSVEKAYIDEDEIDVSVAPIPVKQVKASADEAAAFLRRPKPRVGPTA